MSALTDKMNSSATDASKKTMEMPRNQTKGTIKTQNPQYKKITRNKKIQISGQHAPVWNPEVKSGAPEG